MDAASRQVIDDGRAVINLLSVDAGMYSVKIESEGCRLSAA